MNEFEGLSDKQVELVTDTKSKVKMYIGGSGGGKTLGGAWASIVLSMINPPKTQGLVVAPTFGMIQNPILITMQEILDFIGIPYALNRSKWFLTLPEEREIWFRSGVDPRSSMGINAAWAWIDEAASTDEEVLKETMKRLRKNIPGVPMCRQLIVTGTPEGKRTWVYKMESNPDPTTRVIRVTSYDNPGNPKDWLESLERTYANDPAGHAQYIRGIAADKTGTIYTNFQERHLIPCSEPQAGQVCVGWDFNNHVMPTPLATWNESAGTLHIWGEVVTEGDAQTEPHARRVISAIQQRVPIVLHEKRLIDHWTKPVLAFIDASANHKRTATVTDRMLVHQAGFSIRSANSNPIVTDRIKSVQYAFAHDKLFIDPKGAPMHARAFREHDYDQYGEPRKDNNAEFQPDHFCDAGGYMVSGLIPIGSRHYRKTTSTVIQGWQ